MAPQPKSVKKSSKKAARKPLAALSPKPRSSAARPARQTAARPPKTTAAQRLPARTSSKPSSAPRSAQKSADSIWNVDRALKELKSLGTDKMRAWNAKHGVGSNQFGVKMGDIRTVANRIKRNHRLALDLWKTGNIDAQFLATLLMNPQDLSSRELDRLVRSVTFTNVGDWLHSYVIKEHPHREELRREWMNDTDKRTARAGWRLTAGRVAKQPDGLDVPALLNRIDAEMGSAAPEIQWTMNMCLAEIGIHFPKLRPRALAIGERLGIYRDYPVSKGCTSPFAPIWINEMVRRKG